MYNKTKAKVHSLLHPEIVGETNWDKTINIFIVVLIFLNVLAVMLETIESLREKYDTFFIWFDRISVYIFTLEYVLRVWSSTHEPKYKGTIKGRLKYMLSPAAIIDLLAFLPYYIHVVAGLDLRTLRILRLMRFFRLFRLTAYTQSAQMIYNVFKSRFKDLLLSFVLAVFLIIIASCLLYFAEHNAQPDSFSSIPAAIWWAIVTLTTTGYGDMAPITATGKVLASVIMLIGVTFIALPPAIITAGFLDELKFYRQYKGHNCPHCGKPLDQNHRNDEQTESMNNPV